MDETAIPLRPYQREIVDEVAACNGSVLVELPTGGGKTLIARHIAADEVERGGRVLFVVPKTILLEQTAEAFADLEPQIIHGQRDYDPNKRVFISTLQTAHRRTLGFAPSMIVVDEAHIGFSGKMLQTLLKDFDGRLIGLSATPYGKDGKPLEWFDRHIDRFDLSWMIERGYLVRPRFYKPVKVDLKGVRMTAGDFNLGDLETRFNTIEAVEATVSASAETIRHRGPAVCFCVSIAHAEAMALAYRAAGIEAEAYHSQSIDPDAIMTRFKGGETKVLTNPVSLTAGFDHPPLDTLVIARATRSPNLWRQMVGRALRLHEGKRDAVILDCAGVIDGIGLPTEKIEPVKKRNAAGGDGTKCPACGSAKLYRKPSDGRMLKVCAACGHSEEIRPRGIECAGCGLVHGPDAPLRVEGGTLLLACGCGHETVVSKASGQNELVEVFDPRTVEAIKRRFVADYAAWLVDSRGVEALTSSHARRQFAALSAYIERRPYALERFDPALLADGWRVLPVEAEEALIGVRVLEERFMHALRFDEAVELLKRIYRAKGEALDAEALERTRRMIAASFVDGIERMTVKRLKNLYAKGKRVEEVVTFVPYIEKRKRKEMASAS